jgi:hypothetical protein
MYPLNTILTFTSLTHASAAADLFGEDALESLYDDYGLLTDYEFIPPSREWFNGFHLTFIHSIYGHVVDIKKWRIILDTPEKVRWFEPQVGDRWTSEDLTVTVTMKDTDRVYFSYGRINAPREKERWHTYMFTTTFTPEKRNGQPFPVPQDVKLGEGAL